MEVISTPIPDLFVLVPRIFSDQRGYFFESYNASRLQAAGLLTDFVQDNQSFSTRGVIRGLHYQLAPYDQTKLVRAVVGRILDVVVDIRSGSPTFGKTFSIELSDENQKQLYVPRGFAHGFSVLSESAVVSYKCDNYYFSEAERGINYNDNHLNINWMLPSAEAVVSPKDRILPEFREAEMNFVYQ